MGEQQRNYADVPLVKDVFDRIEWEQVIDGVETKVCDYYSSPLFSSMHEAEARQETEAAAAFCLLGSLASMMLRADDTKQPFHPLATFNIGRSFLLDDIPSESNHWQVLESIVSKSVDPEMRARIADSLWVGKRNYNQALIAIDAYLESASRLEDPAKWVHPFQRLERALRLSASLRNENTVQKVVTHIEELLLRLNGEDPLYFTLRLMQLLLEFKLGDPAKYSALAEEAAKRAESERDWRRAQMYWDVAAQWHVRQENMEAERMARIQAAETYVRVSETAAGKADPDYFGAWIALRSAVEAFRRIPGEQVRVEKLHSKLLEYQQASMATMRRAGTEIDVTELASRARKDVSGLSLDEALQALALIGRSPSCEELRSQVERLAKEFPLQHIFTSYVLTDEGRISGQREGSLGEDKAETFIRAEMFHNATMWQLTHTLGLVEPARRQINFEHNPALRDVLPLVRDNPFVPAGHELLYAKGILAGLDGDFVVATSLLAPQLENSLRHLLAQRGLIVTKLDQEGIQDVKDLNTLFQTYEEEFNDILGKDLTFDLQGLLVKRLGTNLRNRFAHGLMSYEQLQSTQSEYLWWLALRLCVLVLLSVQAAKVDETIDLESGMGDDSE